MIQRSDLKRITKDQLQGKWGLTIVTFIISAIIPTIITVLANIFESGIITIICGIIASIIIGPLEYGLCTFILNIIRKKQVSIFDIFSGFNRKIFLKALIILILRGISVGIGYFILIIPGIILSIMFSQSYFILVDNNHLSAIDCIKSSSQMMKGNKKYFFILILSFIGWFIIGQITCGIGLLWIAPYYKITIGNFYNELNNKVH